MSGPDYLALLREKRRKKSERAELHKLQKDFTQFVQLPPAAKKPAFPECETPVEPTPGILTDTSPDVRSSAWVLHFTDRQPTETWFAPLVTHAEALALYPDAIAAQPFTPAIREPVVPMTAAEEAAIRAWLALIEETDPATIAGVIGQCQRDVEARDYFTGRAEVELPKPDPFDDRRTCSQCSSLIGRRCQAARRGEIAASPSYEPIRDMLQRCEGYAPGPADADRRSGRERWPGLISAQKQP